LVGSKGWTTAHQRFVRLNRAIFHLMLSPKVKHDIGCWSFESCIPDPCQRYGPFHDGRVRAGGAGCRLYRPQYGDGR
jgi:hypothetical protein